MIKYLLITFLLLCPLANASDILIGNSYAADKGFLVSLEYNYKPEQYIGLLSFTNEFDDQTIGLYYRYDRLFDDSKFFLSARLGVLHGYKETYVECFDKSYRQAARPQPGTCTTTTINLMYKELTFLGISTVGYGITDNIDIELGLMHQLYIVVINYKI